jgi:hypothetical protein
LYISTKEKKYANEIKNTELRCNQPKSIPV